MKYNKDQVGELREMARRMRLQGLEMAKNAAGGSHLGGSFSSTEILAVLYGTVMRYDAKKPEWEGRDRFIPSKNHCVLAHFPALAEAGYISTEETLEFQKDGGRLTGYPQRLELGLEYSGGSLGMAISVGVGLALGFRERKMDNKTYILMGDGELNEGSIWEAFMSAAHYKLGNLVAIIDRNHLSYDGDTENIMAIDDLSAKMESFNWNVINCDGHDVADLLRAFGSMMPDKPTVIIAETVKGKGVSFMENKREWHHSRLSQEQYQIAVEEVMQG